MSESLQGVAARRLDAFVDASFAFALTLLVISGSEPLDSYADLGAALARIPAFAVGFALLALFWSAHRRFGQMTAARDGAITLISLMIVFTVMIYVFPLRLLTETGASWMTGGLVPGRERIATLGDLRGIFVSYGLGFAFLSGLYVLLHHVARPDALDGWARTALVRARDIWGICAFAGLVSAGLAALPLLRHMPWLPGFAYWLIPAGIGLYYWRINRPLSEQDAATP
ncbi:TMEM175 family protein [Brevundimonas sp.]|uniref:TMEM175 family protein n=1 Tax=Brevundimonas sp. TaxID=1871086 RepID=UPI003515B332